MTELVISGTAMAVTSTAGRLTSGIGSTGETLMVSLKAGAVTVKATAEETSATISTGAATEETAELEPLRPGEATSSEIEVEGVSSTTGSTTRTNWYSPLRAFTRAIVYD